MPVTDEFDLDVRVGEPIVPDHSGNPTSRNLVLGETRSGAGTGGR